MAQHRNVIVCSTRRDERRAVEGTLNTDEFTGTERFEVQRRLGAGGMGVVYQVYDRERQSVVALKTLKQRDAGAIYRFKREFRGLADISHPNLASLHELVSSGNQWFFTMELVEGTDFLSFVRGAPAASDASRADTLAAGTGSNEGGEWSGRPGVASPPPDMNRLLDAARQLGEGVHALHSAGKLHRDIKPSNVKVTPGGRVVLLDFGLITELAKRSRATTDDNLVGTAAYMAPEQGAGQQLSPASDWYSVGVILYESLTGLLPFDGPPLHVLMEKQRADPVPPRKLLPRLPAHLDELCMALLAREPGKRPSSASVLAALGGPSVGRGRRASTMRTPTAPFVGRTSHIDRLRQAFETTRTGDPVTVLVHGGSGMGKSALVARFKELVIHEHDAVVLSGRCYERESVPYKALDSLIDSLTHYLVELPRADAEALMPRDALAIARLFPVLRRVDAIANAPQRPAALDPLEVRERAQRALRELFARLADRKALVLTVDDMQWGDVDSASLLIDLMRPPEAPAVQLLVCYRSEEATTSEALRLLLGHSDNEHGRRRGTRLGSGPFRVGEAQQIIEVEVGALSPEESRDLALARLGDPSDASRSVAEAIARESGGNPFFVDELVRYVQAGAAREVAVTGLRLEDVMSARLGQLDPPARRLLEVVAVAACPLPQPIARAAADLGDEADTTAAVLRAGHLIRTTGSRRGDELETYHDRIREAVVASMSRDAIRERHQRLARVLESSGHADPEALAVHLCGAGDMVRGAEQAALAAVNASKALAFERAAELYRFAIENLPDETIASQHLHEQLGDALANAGRGAEAAAEYMIATKGARAADAVELKRRAADQLLRSGHVDEGLAALQAVLESLGERMAKTPRRALADLLWRRTLLRLRGLGYRARDTSQIADEQLRRIDTCWSASAGLAMMHTISGADFQTRHTLLALRAGEPLRVARALVGEASYSGVDGARSWKRTQRLLAVARKLATEANDPYVLGVLRFGSAMADYQAGHWRAGFEGFEECIEIYRERCTGVAYEISGAQRFAVDALHNLGEIRELCLRVPAHLREAQRRGDLYVSVDMRSGLPNIAWLAADDPAEARRQAKLGVERWFRRAFHLQHYYDLLARTNIDLYLGDGRAAWQHVLDTWPALRRSMLLRIQAVRAEGWHLRGRAALAAATGGDAPALLRVAEKAAKKLARQRMPGAPALAESLRAGIACARGDSDAGAALYASAAEKLVDADMALYAASCRRRRGELVGGDEGSDSIATADDWMRGQSIRNPARMAAMCAPGIAER